MLLCFLFSCTVQKRHFRKGWTINWHKEKRGLDQSQVKKPIDTLIDFSPGEKELSEYKPIQIVHGVEDKQNDILALVELAPFSSSKQFRHFDSQDSLTGPIKIKSLKTTDVKEKKEHAGAFPKVVLGLILVASGVAIGVVFFDIALVLGVLVGILGLIFLIMAMHQYALFLKKKNPEYELSEKEQERWENLTGTRKRVKKEDSEYEQKEKIAAEMGIKKKAWLPILIALLCFIGALFSIVFFEYGVLSAVPLVIAAIVFVVIASIRSSKYYDKVKSIDIDSELKVYMTEKNVGSRFSSSIINKANRGLSLTGTSVNFPTLIKKLTNKNGNVKGSYAIPFFVLGVLLIIVSLFLIFEAITPLGTILLLVSLVLLIISWARSFRFNKKKNTNNQVRPVDPKVAARREAKAKKKEKYKSSRLFVRLGWLCLLLIFVAGLFGEGVFGLVLILLFPLAAYFFIFALIRHIQIDRGKYQAQVND